MVVPAPALTPLLPWQERALGIPHTYNIFLGGGRGGGKTMGAEYLILQHIAMYRKRARVLVVRPDTLKGSSDFEDGIEAMLKQAYPSAVRRNRTDHVIRVGGGGRVEFDALNAQSVDKHQGREYGLLVGDEVGNFITLKHLDLLRSNLRSGSGIPVRSVLIANPGGPGHTMLARRYINGRIAWKSFEDRFGERWVYIPTTFRDNHFLDPVDYAKKLAAAAGGDSALAKAWIEGDWDAVTGAFFAHVLHERQILADDEWVVPKGGGWESGVGLDWGQTRPSVVLPFAMPMVPGLKGPGGRVYPVGSRIILDEVATVSPDDLNQGLNWPPSMLAEESIMRCRQWGVRPWGTGDDARGLTDTTLLKQLAEHGLVLRKPKKDRISGWVKVKSMLAEAAKEFPEDPGIWIRERCRYLLETLPILQRNKLRVEDLDSTGPDHGVDALRYLCMWNPPERGGYAGGEVIGGA